MFLKPVGLNTWSETFVLPAAVTNAPPGLLQVDYEVTRYDDVRNLTMSRSYLVKCKQRVIIPNTVASTFGPVNTISYEYPIMVINKMAIAEVDGNQATWTLVEYAPKTLNSAIQSSLNTSLGTSSQSTSQYTSGSSTSETNSYEVGVGAGASGLSLSASKGHSDTQASEQSTSSGTSAGIDRQSGSSDSMSIKDWAGFAALNPASQDPDITWVWGQEYPWDVFQYHNIYVPEPGAQPYIQLPIDIMNQMFHVANTSVSGDVTVVYPPSKLSLFGVNFVSVATWLYTVKGAQANPHDQIQFSHQVTCYTGMHALPAPDAPILQVSMDKSWDFEANASSAPATAILDLGQLALDPVPSSTGDDGTIVGFALSQFLAGPENTKGFSIKSTANTLYITGNGFTPPTTNDAAMTADVTKAPATLTIYLKVDDADRDLSLFIKHWKTTETGCLMTIQINPPVPGAGSRGPGSDPITRYIDASESGSGTDNITEIILRKKDYTSADFYDYLALGMNTIDVKIESLDPTSSQCTYAIRAVVVS